MRQRQREDPVISSAVSQLEVSGKIIQGQFKNQLGMALRSGLLCRGRKIVVPCSLKQEIMTHVHREGHPGIDKTTRLIRNQFYWKRMDSDIDRFCRGCLICNTNKPKNLPREKLVSVCVANKLREVVAYDVVTLPWASTHHRYFLLLVDMFSKYIELYPMPDQESSTIIRGIVNGWIHRHGPPDCMISDQGPNVDGTEVRRALEKYGIVKKRSLP